MTSGARTLRDGLTGLAGLAERRVRHRSDLLPVLTYHRVLPPDELATACPSTASATTDRFAAHLAFVAAHRHAVSLDQVLRARRGEERLPPGAVLLTFDDGYADFRTRAWPALRRLGLPVVLFVPTGHIGGRPGTFWWDRLWHALVETGEATTPPEPVGRRPLGSPGAAREAFRALRGHLKVLPHDELEPAVDRLVGALGEPIGAPPVLDWPALAELYREGVAIAPHSVSHPLLTRVDRSRRRLELVRSRHALREALGSAPPAFAYPAGACDDDVATDAGEAGYELAFTTERGVNDLRRPDWLRLRRINVGAGAPSGAPRAQMAPAVARVAARLT